MSSMPDFMRQFFDARGIDIGGSGDYTYNPDDLADIDAFDEAFDEVRQEFLVRRETRGDFRKYGEEEYAERLQTAIRRMHKLRSTDQQMPRGLLVELALCAVESLSFGKGE